MKNKILTAVSTIMLFVPWTILPLRTFDWALESPVAEIMIACYAAFMIFSGVFTIISYVKAKAQNNLMKVCLIVNSLYAVAGIVFLGMMINTHWFCQYHLTHFIRTRIMQRERYDHSRAFFELPEAAHRWRCRFFCWPSNS